VTNRAGAKIRARKSKEEQGRARKSKEEGKEEPKEAQIRSFLWEPSLKGCVLSDYRVNPPGLT
jgi:hypothetical protein